jgi:hypothetical protein
VAANITSLFAETELTDFQFVISDHMLPHRAGLNGDPRAHHLVLPTIT